MAWFDEAIFYHIYPLGLTGAPMQNAYEQPVERLDALIPWLDHIKGLGFDALYIGPLFESVGHGYETTDYYRLDSRLGTNDTLKRFVQQCHQREIRVVLDGVFNHVGRDFFAFKDLKANRESSAYVNWFCNVNFRGNNHYQDGFSYENWGGHDLLVKLNQKNPAVQSYISDVIRFWVREFDIDGIRLDAADVLDFGFMQVLRKTANEVKPDFWLMGEVIHGNYSMWVNDRTLHSVTNYQLHQALFSGHNDHNYFEIAHTVDRIDKMGLHLYNFVDNHDVERICSKLKNTAHFVPVHILLYTLPGVPSVYYGSEFGIEGRKAHGTDAPLRPALNLDQFRDNSLAAFIAALGRIRKSNKLLTYGDYKQLHLSNTQYAFSRSSGQWDAVVTVNNEDRATTMHLQVKGSAYVGALTGTKVEAQNGWIHVAVGGNSGEIWLPENMNDADIAPVLEQAKQKLQQPAPAAPQAKQTASTHKQPTAVAAPADKPYEHMTVPELRQAILDKMAKNGPVTDRMRQDVMENRWRDSLLTWVKSF